MPSDEITVGIVSWYSGSLIAGVIANLEEKVTDSRLRFMVCDNTGGRDQELYDLLHGQCEILAYHPDTSRVKRRGAAGSVAHGQGLNFLFDRLDTEFGLFIDPDCLVLQKGWDLLCRRELANGTIAIGSPYHYSRFEGYQGFPTAIFIFFRVRELKKIGSDWSAYGISLPTRAVTWFWNTSLNYGMRFMGRWFGPSFYVSAFAEWLRHTPLCGQHRDTGWRIPRQAKRHGYAAQVFTPAVLPSQLHPSCSRLPGIRALLANYELFLWREMPILTHFYSAIKRTKTGTREEQISTWQLLARSLARQVAELPECQSLLVS